MRATKLLSDRIRKGIETLEMSRTLGDTWISNHSLIDEEYKKLLDRCNSIIESSLKKDYFDETFRNAEAFLQEIEQHFNDEIEILKDVKYPYIDAHIEIHNKLLQQSKKIYEKTIRKEVTPVELFHFLLTVVMKGHIKNEDSKYRKYLQVKVSHKIKS